MSKETLKVMRLIVPGILIFLVLTPVVQGGLGFDKLIGIDTKSAFHIIVVLILGAIYKTLEARKILFKEDLAALHEHIKDRLLKPFEGDTKISALKDRPAKEFLKVFYNIIDNDNSLTQKTKDIYENGLLWSSYCDLGVICLLGIPVYLVAYLITSNSAFLTFIALLGVLFFVALPFCRLSKKKHQRLGDDQLEVITTIHKERLQKLLTDLSN